MKLALVRQRYTPFGGAERFMDHRTYLRRLAEPDADRLNVCQVDVGAAAPLTIVCGAPNVRVGIKVPCAMVGVARGPSPPCHWEKWAGWVSDQSNFPVKAS